ncbi:uncharacterized protein LOC123293642 [Chrysoperla carnea]|uniref:uncharacterized protein LOC123293642 n=1 Tax=Chrysoperla carnea TaxID=189513 RepID=UPI001D0726C6|nr:uncharacterized protein LOC123293642 [Chrysoperla carnea]
MDKIKFKKLGKKHFVLNGTVVIGNLPADMRAYVLTWKRVGSSFMEQPYACIKNQDACELFLKDTYLVPYLLNSSNIPYKCPIPKGTYEVNNFYLKPNNLPSVIPHGDWKFTFQWRKNNDTLFSITYFAEIVPVY